jgi:hypothetical protein
MGAEMLSPDWPHRAVTIEDVHARRTNISTPQPTAMPPAARRP